MSKILVNLSASPVDLTDCGVTVPASGNYVIPPTDYPLFAASSAVVTKVGNGTLVVNDGSGNLSISDGIDLVKGNLYRYVNGGTSGTVIGNVGDRMKTQTTLAPNTKLIPTLGNNVFWDDMNAAAGGVARGSSISSTFTQMYSYTGSGILLGVIMVLENMSDPSPNSWRIRLQVDGVELFQGAAGFDLGDLLNPTVYDFTVDPTKNAEWLGLSFKDQDFRWRGPMGLPLEFKTSVKVFARKVGGNKLFRAGIVNLTKET